LQMAIQRDIPLKGLNAVHAERNSQGINEEGLDSSSAMPFGSTLEAVFLPIQTCDPRFTRRGWGTRGLSVSAFLTRIHATSCLHSQHGSLHLLSRQGFLATVRSVTPTRIPMVPPEFKSAMSSEVDLSSVYFRRKNSPRMRCYALTFWWMLPVLQIRRHGVLTSFALSQH